MATERTTRATTITMTMMMTSVLVAMPATKNYGAGVDDDGAADVGHTHFAAALPARGLNWTIDIDPQDAF